MTELRASAPSSNDGVLNDEAPADEDATRAFLLKRAKRDYTPLQRSFVQNPDRSAAQRGAPLGEFVKRGDLRGLRCLLFVHAVTSSGASEGGWSTTLPLPVWARAFDTTKHADRRSASTSASKALARLEQHGLITRTRSGRARAVRVTLLRPDGSREPYTRPDGSTHRYLQLNNRYWTEGWYEKLDLPATAMLLVALHEKPSFELATHRVPEWYGFSADTAERGMKTLEDLGLITIRRRVKAAPLSPTGATEVNVYTLTDTFAPPRSAAGKAKTDQSAPAASKAWGLAWA